MISRVLDVTDTERVREICAADPVQRCFVASRVEAGVLSAAGPGELWGYPADRPRSLLHVGVNCMPVASDAESRAAFVEDMGRYRRFASIVGDAAEVLEFHRALVQRWGEAFERTRVVRERQPLMVADAPGPVAPDPRVRSMDMAWFDSYFEGAVAMYTEELGEDPLLTNPVGYRGYVASLIRTRRAFGIVEDDRVIFKADVGVLGAGVAQVQGVWVRPSHRGRGLAAPAMAAVTNRLLERGLRVSLYVNDFNAPAIATYRRCGYQTVGTFASVLY